MTVQTSVSKNDSRELVLTSLINASPDKVYRAWTDPVLMKQWFAPKPYTTPRVELDLRAGGASNIVMRSPEGADMPNPGQFLEVVPNKRLVFTDAFTGDFKPREGKPFMVVTLTFENEDGKTRYTARVRHWSDEDRASHEKMGFHEGWAICANQLAEVAEKL